MFKKYPELKGYALRFVIVAVLSFAFVAVFNEVTYQFQREASDRAPQTINLLIPEGTADRVAAGDPVPAIPDEMVFVLGDTLQVINHDRVDHQLGPVWVPAGSTASLVMKAVENYAYSCSFQTNRVMGIDVRQPTTNNTRLTALFIAGPTTAVLLFLYTLVIFPIWNQAEKKEGRAHG
jgi:hypothetical protein